MLCSGHFLTNTMNLLRLTVWLGLAAAALGVRARGEERERNYWPGLVTQPAPAGPVSPWTGAGPFLFGKPDPEPEGGGTIGGFRPFWVQAKTPAGELRSVWVVYPLFTYAAYESTYHWSFFELIRLTGRKGGAPAPRSIFEERGEFEVWPFWFSRETGDPAFSYRALFPIAGTIKNKLFFERASWVVFPLYFQTEKRGAVTTSAPWPFVRVTRGAAQGFALWPLFGWHERPGVSRDDFYLWPLGYNSIVQPLPEAPPGTLPRHDVGFLPFYARSTGPGLVSETFGWPFFGYTDRTIPYRYHETRYLWPLFVQGRGDERYVNRWGPFYTHSVLKGFEKTWIVWPFFRQTRATDAGLTETKTNFFWFIYLAQEQRSATNPNVRPAFVRHLWPLFSAWDNGAGRRQFQAFSPIEPLFGPNQKMRETWTPFFSIFRRDERAPGDVRTSLFWDFVTWESQARDHRSEFHLGPLLSVTTQSAARRIAVGNGLFGWQREPADGRWRMFWLDFPAKRSSVPAVPVP